MTTLAQVLYEARWGAGVTAYDRMPPCIHADWKRTARAAEEFLGVAELRADRKRLLTLLGRIVMEANPDINAQALNEAEELLTAINEEEGFLEGQGQSTASAAESVMRRVEPMQP